MFFYPLWFDMGTYGYLHLKWPWEELHFLALVRVGLIFHCFEVEGYWHFLTLHDLVTGADVEKFS